MASAYKGVVVAPSLTKTAGGQDLYVPLILGAADGGGDVFPGNVQIVGNLEVGGTTKLIGDVEADGELSAAGNITSGGDFTGAGAVLTGPLSCTTATLSGKLTSATADIGLVLIDGVNVRSVGGEFQAQTLTAGNVGSVSVTTVALNVTNNAVVGGGLSVAGPLSLSELSLPYGAGMGTVGTPYEIGNVLPTTLVMNGNKFYGNFAGPFVAGAGGITLQCDPTTPEAFPIVVNSRGDMTAYVFGPTYSVQNGRWAVSFTCSQPGTQFFVTWV